MDSLTDLNSLLLLLFLLLLVLVPPPPSSFHQAMDAVPLIDAQTAAILGSVNKYTVQQHTKWWDNCIEAPNTYTIFNMDTQQALIRVEEQSDGMEGLG